MGIVLELILLIIVVAIMYCFVKVVTTPVKSTDISISRIPAPKTIKEPRTTKEFTLAELKEKQLALKEELTVTEEMINTADSINQSEQELSQLNGEFEKVYIERKGKKDGSAMPWGKRHRHS